MLALRDRLRQPKSQGGLGLTEAECDLRPDGEPPAIAGERYVAIHEGEWTATDEECLHEYYGVDVTVTFRAGRVPDDRAGTALMGGPTGRSLARLCRQIVALVHKDPGPRSDTDSQEYAIVARANALIDRENDGVASNGIQVPLRLGSADHTQWVGPDWFKSPTESRHSGLARTLHFVGAERWQKIEEQMP